MICLTAFSCLNSINLYIPLKNSIKQSYLFEVGKDEHQIIQPDRNHLGDTMTDKIGSAIEKYYPVNDYKSIFDIFELLISDLFSA